MDAIRPVPPDQCPNPDGKTTVSKVDKYKWTVIDKPGEFCWVLKQHINVDHEYQRANVSNSRVNNIASEWSWAACGALTIGRRPDLSLWAMDGQHRKLAADKRSDILVLPCIVFDVNSQVVEANSFLKINGNRGPVKTLDRFNALVIARDPFAMRVKEMVETDGYSISMNASQHTTRRVKCIATLMAAMKQDHESCRTAWGLSVELFAGQTVGESIFGGLYAVERHLSHLRHGTLLHSHNRESLLRIGEEELSREIQRSVAFHGGGSKAWGEGIIRAMNKGRRTRRIPTLYGTDTETEDLTATPLALNMEVA